MREHYIDRYLGRVQIAFQLTLGFFFFPVSVELNDELHRVVFGQCIL